MKAVSNCHYYWMHFIRKKILRPVSFLKKKKIIWYGNPPMLLLPNSVLSICSNCSSPLSLWLQLLSLYDLHLLVSTTFPTGPVLSSQKRWITQTCLEEHIIQCITKSTKQHPWLSLFTRKSRAVLPKVQSADQGQFTNFITSPQQGDCRKRINIQKLFWQCNGVFFYINYSNKKIKPCIFMYFWSEMENSKKQHTHTQTHTQQNWSSTDIF